MKSIEQAYHYLRGMFMKRDAVAALINAHITRCTSGLLLHFVQNISEVAC